MGAGLRFCEIAIEHDFEGLIVEDRIVAKDETRKGATACQKGHRITGKHSDGQGKSLFNRLEDHTTRHVSSCRISRHDDPRWLWICDRIDQQRRKDKREKERKRRETNGEGDRVSRYSRG